MRLFLVPLLYLVSAVLVLVGVWRVLAFVEYSVGFRGLEPGVGLEDFTTLYFNGDVVAAASIFTIGGLFFGVSGYLLVRLERLRAPTILDHMRRCVLLYAFLGVVGLVLVAAYEANLGTVAPAGSLTGGYTGAILGFLVGGYAVVVDALILLRQRRHFDRMSLEGVA